MGSGHTTHRNKRGGRHTRGASPRAPGAAASTTSASASAPSRPTVAAPAPTSALTPTPPSPPVMPASDTPPSPPAQQSEKNASRPSLRGPYAPGQRALRSPGRSASTGETQEEELEVTAIYREEITVSAQSVETVEDQEEPRYAENKPSEGTTTADRRVDLADVSADADQERPAYRHNGHTHAAGRRNGRHRDDDHEHTYTPAHLSPEVGRDGNRAEQETAPLTDAEHEPADAAPHGDVRGDVGPLIDDLKALFQRDRATASATGGIRCGICYLHFALDALEYRDGEGYYVCAACARALGTTYLPMVRRQKRG